MTTEQPGCGPASRHVLVAGMSVSGYAAADALVQIGARVTVVDDAVTDATRREGDGCSSCSVLT